jgi:hypothetical protein
MPARTTRHNAELPFDEPPPKPTKTIELAPSPIVGLKMTASDRSRERERRREARTLISQQGRYMLADRSEYPCRSADVSPVGIAISGPRAGVLGERVIAYFRDLGRIEGVIVRRRPFWFALDLTASLFRKQRIADRIEWTLKHNRGELRERRARARVEPAAGVSVSLLVGEERFTAQIIDESDVAIALAVEASVDVGARVTVDGWPFRVVRRFDGGLAVHWGD